MRSLPLDFKTKAMLEQGSIRLLTDKRKRPCCIANCFLLIVLKSIDFQSSLAPPGLSRNCFRSFRGFRATQYYALL